MANYGPQDTAFLLVGGRDLLASIVTEIADGVDVITEETTGLGPVHGVWKSSKPIGLKSATFSQSGFFDDATDGVHEALNEQQQTEQVVSFAPAGGGIGAKFVGLKGAFGSKYRRAISTNGLHKASAEYTVTGAHEEGVILHGKTSETTAGNTQSSSHNNATSSANGAAGYLHVPALTLGGYTNVVVKVRHSSDNVTFADLITFTAVTVAPAAQRVEVAGTVNRYTAMSWAYTGAGSGQSVTPVVGLCRG